MGKSLLSSARIHELSRILSSANAQRPPPHKKQPRLPNRVAIPPSASPPSKSPNMETSESEHCRIPLSQAVADCAKRWFQDTLKDAKAGDASMQLLVAQMYHTGYGVPRDPQKGNAWFSKASRNRNSGWKASDKNIGYRTSDSDCNEPENKAKFSR